MITSSAVLVTLGLIFIAVLLLPQALCLQKCIYSKFRGLLLADCKDTGYEEIPSRLRTDFEILDFSHNRLRVLTNTSLSKFSSLKYCYLNDNFLESIEDAAFSSLTGLAVLSMRKTGLRTFPKSIFTMPNLGIIYLAENRLKDDDFYFNSSLGDSNLIELDASKNELTNFLNSSDFFLLEKLNVSSNFITTIRAANVARFCSLKSLDISHNPLEWTDTCACREFNYWIARQSIKMTPSNITCGNGVAKCSGKTADKLLSPTTLAAFESCEESLVLREKSIQAKKIWIGVGSTLGIGLFLVLIILYCVRKRNKKNNNCTKGGHFSESRVHVAQKLIDSGNHDKKNPDDLMNNKTGIDAIKGLQTNNSND